MDIKKHNPEPVFVIHPAKKFWAWATLSLCVFWFWSMLFWYSLEYLGVVSMKATNGAGRSSSPDWYTVVILIGFTGVLYFWRYTMPPRIHVYEQDSWGRPQLSRRMHAFLHVVTFMLGSAALCWNAMDVYRWPTMLSGWFL